MDTGHRKIELQSPEDLTYLITNVRRAAAAHIADAFPPVTDADGGDELRMRIEQMVDEYISQTFTLAAPNLSINGFDLDRATFPAVYLSAPTSPSKQQQQEIVQYEPFDARKRERLEALARDEEDLMREIATLKKTLPAAAARGYNDGFWEGVRGDEEGFGSAKAGIADAAKGAPTVLEGGAVLERGEDVERSFKGVVGTLGRMRREMPATVARMERARVAGEYVVTER